MGIQTSRVVWLTLEKMFASEAKACVMQTLLRLTTMKKGSVFVANYFMQAQCLSNLLATVNEPVKDTDLVCYVIGGLLIEFDPLVTSLTTHLEPISLGDLYAHLLTFEQRLERNNSISDLANSLVHVAQCHTNSHGKPQRQFFVSNGPFSGRGCGKGRGHGPSSSPLGSFNRPTCQLYLQIGHIIAKCYHRYDHAYQVPSPPLASFMNGQINQLLSSVLPRASSKYFTYPTWNMLESFDQSYVQIIMTEKLL